MYSEKKEKERIFVRLHNAVQICATHSAAKFGWPADEIRVLLLVDEMGQQTNVYSMQGEFGFAMDFQYTAKLLPLFTSSDSELFKGPPPFYGNRRPDLIIGLKALDDSQVRPLFRDLYSKLTTDLQRQALELCFVDSDGHGLSLEHIHKEFERGISGGSKWEPEYNELVDRIFQATFPKSSIPTIESIALGLRGERVHDTYYEDTDGKLVRVPTVDHLVRAGIYLNCAQPSDYGLSIRFSGLLIRRFLRSIKLEELPEVERFDVDTPARKSSQTLVKLLADIAEVTKYTALSARAASLSTASDERGLDPSRGPAAAAYIRFHCTAELIKLHATVMCLQQHSNIKSGRFVIQSLIYHYRIYRKCYAVKEKEIDVLFGTDLLWPLASLELTSQHNSIGELCEDVMKARVDHQFVPPVRLYSSHVFDAAIVVREARCPKKVWCILLDVKCSQPDVSNQLSLHDVNERVSTLLDSKLHEELLQKASHLVYVLVAWREPLFDVSNWKPSAELLAKAPKPFPYSVLILDRRRLEEFYFSLSPQANYIAGHRVFAVRIAF